MESEAGDESDWDFRLSPALGGLWKMLYGLWRSWWLLMVVVVERTEHRLTKPAFIMNH